jgi:hypothetical protein
MEHNKENLKMMLSQVKEAQHHILELSKVVKSNSNIEPWVIAKMERATTDLSDITHYLDGYTFALGGNLTSNYFDKEEALIDKEIKLIQERYDNPNLSSDEKSLLKSRFKVLLAQKERLEMKRGFNKQIHGNK